MCGICGIIHWDGRAADADLVRCMADLIRHRGPDDEGFHFSGPLGLGFRRLSIIDLAGGRQPMPNEDGTVHVICNGEIYNFKELRAVLTRRGHRFRTLSDIEVIAHGYEEWGDDVVRRLRGMFALALWDESAKRLLVARDRLGIKPLYACVVDGTLAFASEIKCLREVPGIDLTLDEHALADYFSHLYLPPPQSIYRGIRQVMPGQILMVQHGKVAVREYWNAWVRTGEHRNIEDWCEALRAQILQSVESHMVADVPLGVWLSGGLDSSAVTASMARATRGRILSFSAGFDVPAYDETPHAQLVSRHVGTLHETLPIGASSMELLPKLLWFLDEPFADSTIIPTYILSERTRERVTVVLSGEGGDELFGGYTHYQGMELNRLLRTIPSPARQWLAGLLGELSTRNPLGRGYALHRMERVVASSLFPPFEDFLRKVAVFSPEEIQGLFSPDFLKRLGVFTHLGALRRAGFHQEGLDPVSRAMLSDLLVYLPGDMLTKVDRMSMACSLEVRVPLLDHDLVELALSIPRELKLHGMRTKVILRKALSPWLPDSILRRPKRGFNPPLEFWLQRNLHDYAHDWGMMETLRDTGMFHDGTVRTLMDDHIRGTRDNSRKLWALLVFAVWWRHVRNAREVP